MRLVLIGIIVVLSSCKGQKKTISEHMNSGTNFPLTLVLQDNYSGSDESETLIIKDSKALKIFFSKLNRTRKPRLPVPEIDFSKEMAIVLCSGIQNNDSWPRLSLFEEMEQKMIFSTIQKVSDNEHHTASTSPFCIYKMPLTSKEIIFKKPE